MENEVLDNLLSELKKNNEINALSLLLDLERRFDDNTCREIREQLGRIEQTYKYPELTDGMKENDFDKQARKMMTLHSYLAALEIYATLFKNGYFNIRMIQTSVGGLLMDLKYHTEVFQHILFEKKYHPNLLWLLEEI